VSIFYKSGILLYGFDICFPTLGVLRSGLKEAGAGRVGDELMTEVSESKTFLSLTNLNPLLNTPKLPTVFIIN